MGAETPYRAGTPRRIRPGPEIPAHAASMVSSLPAPAADDIDAATRPRACRAPAPDATGRQKPDPCYGIITTPPIVASSRVRAAAPRPVLRIILPGTHDGVRHALANVSEALQNGLFARACPGGAEDGTIELVLAEVLNNIVEHAYADGPGLITLDLRVARGRLFCLLRDEGHPMPAGRLPHGLPPSIALAQANLPEGGFGWFLIRRLTRDLRYDREPGCNRLSFSIPQTGAVCLSQSGPG